MNIKEALMEFCIFEPMTVRDLSGKIREEIIQVDILVLAKDIEKALRVAIEMSYKSGLAFNRGILLDSGDDCVKAFISELEKA